MEVKKEIKQCTYCGNRVFWDFKIRNQQKKDGSFYKGYWREVNQDESDGQVHTYQRCQELQKTKPTQQVKEELHDIQPLGQKTEQPKQSPPSSATDRYGQVPKVDEEFLKIIGVCGEVEKGIYTVAQEIFSTRKTGSVDDIADRLTEIYSTRKINERLDKIIQELDRRTDS